MDEASQDGGESHGKTPSQTITGSDNTHDQEMAVDGNGGETQRSMHDQAMAGDGNGGETHGSMHDHAKTGNGNGGSPIAKLQHQMSLTPKKNQRTKSKKIV